MKEIMGIRLKDLSKLGYTNNVARSLAVAIVNKHCKYESKEEILVRLANVLDNPEAYITRILANLVRNCARLSWHNELPIDVLPESTLSTDGVGMRLCEVLPKGLSPQEQEILLLRFEERLSYSEIADVLKIKEASCRSRLMRAKAHLLNLYEKEKIL